MAIRVNLLFNELNTVSKDVRVWTLSSKLCNKFVTRLNKSKWKLLKAAICGKFAAMVRTTAACSGRLRVAIFGFQLWMKRLLTLYMSGPFYLLLLPKPLEVLHKNL